MSLLSDLRRRKVVQWVAASRRGLGDLEGSLPAVRAARERRDVWYIFAHQFWEFASLREDPRFQALLPGS